MIYAFSDDSPFREFAAFLVTTLVLCALLLLLRQTAVGRGTAAVTDAFARYLRRRIFTGQDPLAEARRLDLLRILLGSLAVIRNGANFSLAVEMGDVTTVLATGLSTLLSLGVLVGFATPLTALVFCLVLNPFLDNISRTSSLSSLVMSMSLLPIILAPAGRHLSVDALILRGTGRAARSLAALYRFVGAFTLERAAIGKFLLLLCYAAISFSSGLLHLQFEVWREGLTNTWMFISPVANPRYHAVAGRFYELAPWLYVLVTKASAYGTLVFQLLLIPLLLASRWTRRLVVFLEYGFVLGSIFLLALAWLGWNQLALCLILFWNRWRVNEHGRDTLVIAHDPASAVSRWLVFVIRGLDVFRTLDVRAHPGAARGPAGGGALIAVAGRVLLLLPFWPIAWLLDRIGLIRDLGGLRLVEGAVGVGGRDDATSATGAAARQAPSRPLRGGAFYGTVSLSVVAMLVVYATRLPIQPWWPGFRAMAEASRTWFGQAPLAYGLFQINAFNFPPITGPLFAGEVRWRPRPGEADRMVTWIPPVRAAISVPDTLFYQTVVQFNLFRDGGFCYTPTFLRHILTQPALSTVLRREGYRGGEFSVSLNAFEVPSRDDFRAGRFVPLSWQRICEVSFAADAGPARLAFRHDQPGLDRLAHRAPPLPFRLTAAGADIVANYPCRPEAERIAYWFDRPNLAPRTDAALPATIRLLSDVTGLSSASCLANVRAVLDAMDLDWRAEHPPRPGSACEPDLRAARGLGEAETDAAEARVTLEALRRAEEQNGAGDPLACLMTVAGARRAVMARLERHLTPVAR